MQQCNPLKYDFSSSLQAIVHDDHPFDRQLLDLWSQLPQLFSKRTYRRHNEDITLSPDWSIVLPRLNDIRNLRRLSAAEREEASHRLFWELDNIILPIAVEVESTSFDRSVLDYSDTGVADLLMYDMFLVMNLAVPGSFACGQMPPESDHMFPFYDVFILTLQTDEYDYLNGDPCIDPKKVMSWYTEVHDASRQISANPAERALFALLHLSCIHLITPELIMWLANAIEGLYVSPDPIHKLLAARAEALLEIPLIERKRFRAALRRFYEFRSDYVHGRQDVPHLLCEPSYDEKAGKYAEKLCEAQEFGLCLLLATLRKYIREGWQGLEFSEIPTGLPTGDFHWDILGQ